MCPVPRGVPDSPARELGGPGDLGRRGPGPGAQGGSGRAKHAPAAHAGPWAARGALPPALLSVDPPGGVGGGRGGGGGPAAAELAGLVAAVGWLLDGS